MNKLLLCLLSGLLLTVNISLAQKKFKQSWKDLNTRPVPGWFTDAKFGIFIHWGPYSVPAYSKKGTYSEWYQWDLNRPDGEGEETKAYHKKVYGPHFSYYNFGEMFTADLFDAKQWAALFKKAGAQYVVPTSKHHDGYCLWPSEEATKSFGFPWNSAVVGPKRDLLGELTEAVREQNMRMGFYYSLYEWFNPLWLKDKDKYIEEHMFPQFKDVVNRYKPAIIFSDGEWSISSEQWRSAELIAWLYNDSEAPEDVVINDRWGKGRRHKDGGYYTTEYESGLDNSHPWEENRGIGFSFGYNRNEDIEDYNSGQTLTLMLIDIVSRGGNFLLDIGPDKFGKIPPIMQERLLQIGKWLEINGECIYGTTTWEKPFQWSEKGKRDYKAENDGRSHLLGGGFILKQTIDPTPGNAVKEVFFTRKGNDLYAISPLWPGSELLIRDLNAETSSEIIFLSTKQKLKWENKGSDLVIKMPDFNPNGFVPEDYYSFVFKISVKE
jgi:alpha-L-fucosidase